MYAEVDVDQVAAGPWTRPPLLPVLEPSRGFRAPLVNARLVPQPLRDLHLTAVGTVPVGPRLEQHRKLREAPLSEEHAQSVLAELTLAEDRVTVAVRAERGRRVVQVERPQAGEPDFPIELVDHRPERDRLADLVPRREEVARVEADAEALAGARDVDHLREFI